MKEENFACDYVPDEAEGLLVMVRDRAVKNDERWVLAYLDKDQQVKLYNYLKEHLKKD